MKPLHYNYRITTLLKLQKLLEQALQIDYLHKILVGSEFDALIDLVCEVVPTKLNKDIVRASLLDLAGKPITANAITQASWRIAGNTPRLKEGHPVPAWHVQRMMEYVPAQIVSCQLQKNARGNIGALYGFRILAGTPSGLLSFKWWSLKVIRFLSRKFGYSGFRSRDLPKFPYSAPEQLVGLRLLLLIHPDYCDKLPGFDKVTFKPSLSEWNLKVLRRRNRTMPGFVCKAKRTIMQPCHTCNLGFLSCPAGTHRADWIKRECPGCNAVAWFDPDRASTKCIACTTTDIYKGT